MNTTWSTWVHTDDDAVNCLDGWLMMTGEVEGGVVDLHVRGVRRRFTTTIHWV